MRAGCRYSLGTSLDSLNKDSAQACGDYCRNQPGCVGFHWCETDCSYSCVTYIKIRWPGSVNDQYSIYVMMCKSIMSLYYQSN